MNTILRLILGLFLVLSFTSCGYIPAYKDSHTGLLTNVSSWLRENSLPSDSIAIPEGYAELFGDRPVIEVKTGVNTFDVLGVIDNQKPEFILTVNSLIWDGVKHQLWFRERYKPLKTFYDNYDLLSPAVIYVYQPSPYDMGEWINITQRFADDAPIVTAYNIDSTRIFPGNILYLSLKWESESFIPAE